MKYRRFDPKRFALAVRGGRGKISVRQFAKFIGTSASTLSRIERGQLCDIETFLLLCDALGLNPGQYGGSKSKCYSKADGLGLIRQGLDILDAGKRMGRWK